MVLAIRKIYGFDIPLGVGPIIKDGFYQDLLCSFTSDEFEKIEEEMRQIIKANIPFERQLVSFEDALSYFRREGQRFKCELIESIQSSGSSRLDGVEEEEVARVTEQGLVSLYKVGDHIDLCRGPHVERTGELHQLSFRLDRVAGAYWRGDEKNEMLTRIYALAFLHKEELERHLSLRQEALLRDHRRLGESLELFFFHETAPGMPYWLPKGLKMKNTLISYWRQYHEARGYQEISAPLLNKKELWQISGHLEHYRDNMFLSHAGEETWALKPMNCANAMIVWKFRTRSWRELPLRLSDIDTLHRDERSGSLSGLLRCQCFCQDDSHNFVSEDQIASEIGDILEIIKDFYSVLGLLDGVKLYLSTRPDDYIGEKEVWDKAEGALRDILDNSSFSYGVKPKDGAFYGPKIDIHLMDALGREWQCGTVQLDFQLPQRFDLTYVDQSGGKRRPVVIHRVIYGSLERFIGILVEHFGGRFPLWLAPEQVRILSLGDEVLPYVQEVEQTLSECVLTYPLRHNSIRYTVDSRNESLSRKVRDGEIDKVPLLLIVGAKERNSREVVVRRGQLQEKVSLDRIQGRIQEMSLEGIS